MPTRTQLRQRIGRRLGDALILRSTAASSASQFTDHENLLLPSDQLYGRVAYCSAGHAANLGLRRRVVTNDEDSFTLTVNPAFPQPFNVGDTLELYRMNDQGVMPNEIHDAINEAIDEVRVDVFDAVTEAMVFDRGTPMIALPTNWVAAYNVTWEDHNGNWFDVPPAEWHVDRGLWTLTIGGLARHRAHTANILIHGYTEAQPLNSDTDSTDIDSAWLVARSCAIICANVSMRQSDANKDRWERRGLTFQTEADARRMYVPTRPESGNIYTRV